MQTLQIEPVELVIGRGGGHYYKSQTNPAELYSSVTTVTGTLNKPALVPWAKKMALDSVRSELLRVDNTKLSGMEPKEWAIWVEGVLERAKKKPTEAAEAAADVGTRAHACIEQMLKGERPMTLEGVEEDIRRCVKGFLDWWKTVDLEIVGSEIRLCSHKVKVGGSMDFLAQTKDSMGLAVMDFKTSKGIWAEMFFQVGGYAVCIEEMMPRKVTSAWIIRFPKTDDDPLPFEAVQVPDLRGAMKGFIELAAVFRRNKEFDAFLKRK